VIKSIFFIVSPFGDFAGLESTGAPVPAACPS